MLMLPIATGCHPRPRPSSKLAEALEVMGSAFPSADALTLFNIMCKPGREGVRVAINAHHCSPEWLRSGILVELYERRINRSGFAAVLVRDWTDGAARTAAAAGTREQLVEWFRYARFDFPFVRRFCDLEALPARTMIWRGLGNAAVPGLGMSWSPSRQLAAYYGHGAWCKGGRKSEPVLLRQEITRDQALAYLLNNVGGEVVIDGTSSYEIDTADHDEIACLATEAEPLLVAGVARHERAKAEALAMSEDEQFAGWEG
jgi:hypothetical protein